MSIRSVIGRIRKAQGGDDQWLCVADNDRLSLETDADLGEIDFDEDEDEEVYPADFVERGLHSTIDYQTARSCIEWADQLSGSSDDEAAVDVLDYYIRFDAFPEKIGAPDPPPFEETQLRLDREFYDTLGEESATKTCRRDGCERGCIQFSVLCRPHHFESIQNRPSPFNH